MRTNVNVLKMSTVIQMGPATVSAAQAAPAAATTSSPTSSPGSRASGGKQPASGAVPSGCPTESWTHWATRAVHGVVARLPEVLGLAVLIAGVTLVGVRRGAR